MSDIAPSEFVPRPAIPEQRRPVKVEPPKITKEGPALREASPVKLASNPVEAAQLAQALKQLEALQQLENTPELGEGQPSYRDVKDVHKGRPNSIQLFFARFFDFFKNLFLKLGFKGRIPQP